MVRAEASLYIHIPFCTRKCPYCHFYVKRFAQEQVNLYLQALKKEWSLRAPLMEGFSLVSLYLGGGTPSLLSVEEIGEILEEVRRRVSLADEAEITLEANPEYLDALKLQRLRALGINRLSIGVQSFEEHELSILGRTHDRRKSIEVVEAAKGAGFENLSIDLMMEVPEQTEASFERSVKQALHLPITHLSLYNLTFEPQTAFYAQRRQLKAKVASDEQSVRLLNRCCELLEEGGFKRYEISAFALEGYEAVHNRGYWEGRPFLGLGPSAFSHWGGERFRNIPDLRAYAERLEAGVLPIDFSEKLPLTGRLKEQLAIRLRLFEPIDLRNWQLPKETLESLHELKEQGLLSIEGDQAALSARGRLFYDTVAEELI